MNRTHPQNKRAIKTKKAIMDAFLELMKFKNINDITVKEIAENADINRKTFYSYYDGIYQLIEELENDILEKQIDSLKLLDVDLMVSNTAYLVEKMAKYFSENLEIYNALSKQGKQSFFICKLSQKIKENIKCSLNNTWKIDEFHLDFLIDYTLSGVFFVLLNWQSNEKTHSLTELSEMLSIYIRGGLEKYLSEFKTP